MSMTEFESRATRLAALVRRTRRSLVATVLAAGLLLSLAIALAWVVGGVVLDIAAPLSVPGRQAVWCGWWIAVATAVAAFLAAPAMRWPLLDAVTLRIEKAVGDAHNQLLTVVDLARRPTAAGDRLGPDGRVLRADMVRRLLDQTQQRLRGFRSTRVLPWPALLRNLAIAGAAAGCIAVLHAVLGARFATTIDRLLHPTADIPPATWLQLESPGDIDVLEGEPLDIRGRVTRGTVDAATLVIFDAAGRPGRQPMRPDGDGRFLAVLEGLDQTARYRLEAGNTWTKTHSITLLERPEIESVACRVRLPDYMRIDVPLAVAADARRIEAPEGATIEFAVAASPDAASGVLRLSERSLVRDVVERLDERVWFEDDVPRDAVSDTPWRWTTAHAAGGLRSFACGTAARPLAMRTRLEPLVLPRERADARAFSLMARSDPADAPARLTVLLEHGQSKTELLWGDAAEAPAAAGVTRILAGPLPRAGEWSRLTVPMKSLAHAAGQPVTAATFVVDRGRLLLDRPGWVERSEEEITRPVDTPVGEIPLAAAAQEATGPRSVEKRSANELPAGDHWFAALPVDKPLSVTAEVRSRRGHANLPTPPIDVVPTVDRPPSIVVDGMPETLVLKAPDDVPVTGRGFDDWGIDEICVLAGTDPARLGVCQTLPGASPAVRPPVTQLPITTAISAEALGLMAGKSVVWRLRIRDTKGQVAESKLFRVTVLTPPESDLVKTQVPALPQARREAEQLAREAARKAAEADAKLAAVREAVAAEEIPDKKSVDELAARLDRERRMADQLAKVLEKAADQAERSDLVPDQEKEAIAAMAAQARSLERRLAGVPPEATAAATAAAADPAADPGTDARKAANQAAAPASAAEDAGRQTPPKPAKPMKEADVAKADRVTRSPLQEDVQDAAQALADRLEDVERRLDARGAALQIDALAKDLQRRVDRLTQEPRQPREESERARQQVRDIEQILGRKIPAEAPRDGRAADPQAAPDTAGMRQDDDAGGERPTAPPPGKPAVADTRAAADRNAATAAVAAAEPSTQRASPATDAAQPQPPAAAPTPSAVAPAVAAAADTADAAAALAARLSGAAPAPETDRSSTPSPAPATDGEPSQESRVEDLQRLLKGPEVRTALAMAERARRLQAREAAQAEAAARAAAAKRARDGRKPDEAPRAADDPDASTPDDPSDGGAMTGRTTIESADVLRGLDAQQRAAIYKLPPHVRDPLLDGMRQRGPDAYQGVIDSYFRQLGKDIPP